MTIRPAYIAVGAVVSLGTAVLATALADPPPSCSPNLPYESGTIDFLGHDLDGQTFVSPFFIDRVTSEIGLHTLTQARWKFPTSEWSKLVSVFEKELAPANGTILAVVLYSTNHNGPVSLSVSDIEGASVLVQNFDHYEHVMLQRSGSAFQKNELLFDTLTGDYDGNVLTMLHALSMSNNVPNDSTIYYLEWDSPGKWKGLDGNDHSLTELIHGNPALAGAARYTSYYSGPLETQPGGGGGGGGPGGGGGGFIPLDDGCHEHWNCKDVPDPGDVCRGLTVECGEDTRIDCGVNHQVRNGNVDLAQVDLQTLYSFRDAIWERPHLWGYLGTYFLYSAYADLDTPV